MGVVVVLDSGVVVVLAAVVVVLEPDVPAFLSQPAMNAVKLQRIRSAQTFFM